MNQTIFIVLVFWSTVYLIHSLLLNLKQTSLKYAKFLHKTGFSINLFQIKWFTVKLNRLFIKLSTNINENFLKVWFNIGVVIGILGQLLSVMLLIYNIIEFLSRIFVLEENRVDSNDEQLLVPIIPGVNLPSSQFFYYFLTLFLSGLVHEFGHAIAATSNNVRVNGFGLFIIFVFPGAFVDLNSDHVNYVNNVKKLRIFCAGIWHNCVFVVVCLLCIKVHPNMVNVLFDKAIIISEINQNSPLSESLKIGSQLLSLDNCSLIDSKTWIKCINELRSGPRKGYCMLNNDLEKLATVKRIDTNIENDCCNNDSSKNYCFYWTIRGTNRKSAACLQARNVINGKSCITNLDCEISGYNCLIPIRDNSSILIKIDHNDGEPILFVGSLEELIYSIRIQEYRPKYFFIPKFLNNEFELLLKYLIAFNAAIAILNLVPCYALDGQYILAAIMLNRSNKYSLDYLDESSKTYKAIMIFGTSLLIVNLMTALYSLTISR